MAKKKSESNTGIVVTMVFFILATIGLGISTYTGYAGQEGPTSAEKKARADEKVMKESRDYWKFQAQLLKAYIGRLPDADLGELSQRLKDFETGALGKSEASKAEVEKIVKDL